MVEKFQHIFGRGQADGGVVTDPQSCEGRDQKALGGVVIKIKHVTCGQDARLPSWETSLTHCACPPAKTLRSAPASFLSEQGTLCLTSLASTWVCGELNYQLRRYANRWDKSGIKDPAGRRGVLRSHAILHIPWSPEAPGRSGLWV